MMAAALTADQQRAQHHGPRGCRMRMTSRGCPGCDNGVPYPHVSTKALLGRMAAARETSTKESPMKPQKVDSTPKPTAKKPATFRMETGARQQLLARIAGNAAAGVLSNPSESVSGAEAIAEIAVDVAETILTKIGI